MADQTRGLGEAAAVADLGAAPPRDSEQRAYFGDGEGGVGGFGPGKWKVLCPPGTAVVLDYSAPAFPSPDPRAPGPDCA